MIEPKTLYQYAESTLPPGTHRTLVDLRYRTILHLAKKHFADEIKEIKSQAHEAGVEAERKRVVSEVEKMKTIEKVMQVFPDGTELVENTGLVNVSDILTLIRKRGLTNQGETK